MDNIDKCKYLTVGTYTIKDICKWFNISKPTWLKHKKEYLEDLSIYCDFYYNDNASTSKKTIEVLSLYTEDLEGRVYTKINKKQEQAINIIKKYIVYCWFKTGLKSYAFQSENCSCANLTKNALDYLLDIQPKLLELYSESSLYRLVLQVIKKYFGVPKKMYYNSITNEYVKIGENGMIGERKRVILVKNNDNTIRYLNAQEEKIKQDIINSIYKDIPKNKALEEWDKTIAKCQENKLKTVAEVIEDYENSLIELGKRTNLFIELKKHNIKAVNGTEVTIYDEYMGDYVTMLSDEF